MVTLKSEILSHVLSPVAGEVPLLSLFHILCRCHYDPNAADSCGVTPLMDAVRGNHVAMTTFLIHEYGVGTV